MKTNKEIIEEFREKIQYEFDVHQVVAMDKRPLIECLIELFTQALDQKEREVREEIVGEVENIKQREIKEEPIWNDGKREDKWYKGFYQALDDVISNLKQPKE